MIGTCLKLSGINDWLLDKLTNIRFSFYRQHQEIEFGEAEDRGLVERHPHEGRRQDLCVHLTASPLQVVPLPVLHVAGGLPGPHGEQVGHQGGEPRGQAGLGDEAELELRQTDDVVSVGEGPAGDVHEVGLEEEDLSDVEGGGDYEYLVVVLHQLDDDPQVVGVVLYWDDSHNVRFETSNINIIW